MPYATAGSRSLTLGLFLFAILAYTSAAFGQVEPDTVRRNAWQQFQDQRGPEWTVRWNSETGTPASVTSGLTKPYSGPPVQAAKTFLQEHRQLFGMEPELSNLQLRSADKLREVTHVRFQQTYRDIPVYEAQYLVHVREDGRVDMANGHYYPKIEAPATPRISEQAARQVATRDLGGAVELRRDITSKLVIYPEDDQFLLAWKVVVPAKEPFGTWRYFIDATDGNIIQKRDLFMHATEEGNVFPTYAGHTPTQPKDLYRLDGNGRLEGTYVNVVNEEANDAYESDHQFLYDSMSTHFDEVMAYYHVDTYRANYIEGFGFNGFTEATAHVHDPGSPCNAGYDPGTTDVYFGDSDGCSTRRNFAWEDKWFYHEYNHAVTHHLNDGIGTNRSEEGAISEGNADYFAGSYADYRATIGDWAAPYEIRDMTNPEISSYWEYQQEDDKGSNGVEPHAGGEFWSAVLWDLRGASGISASEADWLVYARH